MLWIAVFVAWLLMLAAYRGGLHTLAIALCVLFFVVLAAAWRREPN